MSTVDIRLIAFIVLGVAVYGEGVCAVRVVVRGSSGEPTETRVTLRMDDGRSIGHAVTHNGIAEFCDVGWGTFAVIVGPDMCGQVTVSHLSMLPSETVEVPVVYKNCHGFTVAGPGCMVLVRAVTADGIRLPGASVSTTNSVEQRSTDRYGRAFVGLKLGTSSELIVKYKGYESRSVDVECARPGQNVEKTVSIGRSQRAP